MGKTFGRRRKGPVRLAERQVRSVMADCSHRFGKAYGRQGSGESQAGDGGDVKNDKNQIEILEQAYQE